MTFIASVIAKNGIAMVADSFVTTSEQSIDQKSLVDYLKKHAGKTNIPITEVIKLFKKKTSHTRNYVDKLFPFDKYSAVACAGAANINGKEVKDVIDKIAIEMENEPTPTVEDMVKLFCSKLHPELTEHFKKNDITETDFIFSHFDINKKSPHVFVIKITKTEKANFKPEDLDKIVTYSDRTHLKIITDGQDNFVDRLIFGSLYTSFYEIKEEFIKYNIKTFKPRKKKREEMEATIRDFDFLNNKILEDFFSIKLRELSLQEAVDFASLLMKIVMDIQVYTEKIPTVGGLIRLAVITPREDGFKWICGDRIIAPKIIS